LDGRLLKTPAHNELKLPNFQLASMIAVEWDSQIDSKRGIQPSSMPITSLTATAIDQVSIDEEYTKKICLSYLPTDTTLFYASDQENLLLDKQRQYFDPVISWLESSLDIKVATTQSSPIRVIHPEKTLSKINSLVNRMVRIYLYVGSFVNDDFVQGSFRIDMFTERHNGM
jgi:chaperone required for assembly of F1-ATPase